MEDRPIHLYFSRKPVTLMLGPDIMEKLNKLPKRMIPCSSWSMLPEFLKEKPVAICFSHSELKYSSAVEIVNMVHTLSKLVGVTHDIPISVSVDLSVDINTIKLLQKSNIAGIIPETQDFTWEESAKALTALWAKIPYWPKHIIDQLPGARQPKSQSGVIKLTPRQQQIHALIQSRGASNKAIARVLGISESTVKLHITEIFKKYGVRNRTQLAVFSHS